MSAGRLAAQEPELPAAIPRLTQVWPLPGPPGPSVLAVGPASDCLYKVTFARNTAGAIYCLAAEPVAVLPAGTLAVAVCAKKSGAVTVAVFDDRCEELPSDAPRVEPPPPRPLDLCYWTSGMQGAVCDSQSPGIPNRRPSHTKLTTRPHGGLCRAGTQRWVDVCQVPRESSCLAVSAVAAVWATDNNYISEESGAGAFYGAVLGAYDGVQSLTPPDQSLPPLESGALPAGAGKVRLSRRRRSAMPQHRAHSIARWPDSWH